MDKKIRSLLVLSIVAIMLLGLLSACSTPSANTTPVAPIPIVTQDKPQTGGDLTLISSVPISNIGVPYEMGSPGDLTYGCATVETLLRMDEKGLPMPWLATGWTLSPDLKSLTLTLRKGVKFHDGTDFNAEAVKYCLDKYRTGAMPDLKAVSSVDIIDDYTVRLTLSQFQSSLISSLYNRPGMMVSPTSLQNNPKEFNYTHGVGTGPFKYGNYQRDISYKVVKFDGYWQKGKPYLDSIEWIMIADPGVSKMTFESGKAQATAVDGEYATQLKQAGNITITSTSSFVSGLIPDSATSDSPFSKLEVRQAVSYTIDNTAIAKAIGYGYYQPATQLAPKGSMNYDSGTVGYPYNPAKGKELLAKAGYASGFKAKLSYVNTSVVRFIYPVVQANLQQVGIEVVLDPVAQPLFVQKQTKGWDNALLMGSFPAQTGIDFGQTLLNTLSGKSAQCASIIHPEDYEAKILQSLGESNDTKRIALYNEIMKLAVDKYCLMSYIIESRTIFAKRPQVHDLRMTEFWYSQWTPEDAWLSK